MRKLIVLALAVMFLCWDRHRNGVRSTVSKRSEPQAV